MFLRIQECRQIKSRRRDELRGNLLKTEDKAQNLWRHEAVESVKKLQTDCDTIDVSEN